MILFFATRKSTSPMWSNMLTFLAKTAYMRYKICLLLYRQVSAILAPSSSESNQTMVESCSAFKVFGKVALFPVMLKEHLLTKVAELINPKNPDDLNVWQLFYIQTPQLLSIAYCPNLFLFPSIAYHLIFFLFIIYMLPISFFFFFLVSGICV